MNSKSGERSSFYFDGQPQGRTTRSSFAIIKSANFSSDIRKVKSSVKSSKMKSSEKVSKIFNLKLLPKQKKM